MLISVEEKDNGEIIKLKKGDELKIILSECISSGYTWIEKSVKTQKIVSLVNEEILNEYHSLIGGNSKRIWLYKACELGQRIIRHEYQRPWQKEIVKSFEITVTVE
jgi:predicted secreted protein